MSCSSSPTVPSISTPGGARPTTPEGLRRGLTHLQASEFLYETSVFADLEYTFKHALTYEIAYGSVLHDRRRALHARIVEPIEAVYTDRLAEQVERLAHHAFRGEVWEKAVTYLRQAGVKALSHSAYREAVSWFDQALTALHTLPDTRQKVERAIDLRLQLRQSLFPLSELVTALGYLREAEVLARTLDDPRRLGWVSAYMCGHHLHTGGDVTEVRTLAQRVEAIADAHGLEAIRIAEALDHPFSVVVGSLGHVYARSGRIAEGVSCLQQALADSESAGIGYHHSLSVVQLGEAYLLADQLDDARACADRAVMLARGRGERGYEAWALRLLAEVTTYRARPDVPTAAAHYGAAMNPASELEMRPLLAHCHLGLGRLYRHTGKPEQAKEHLTTAAAMYGEMGMTYWLEKLEKDM